MLTVAGDQCSAPSLRCVGLVHHVRDCSLPAVLDVKWRLFLELTLCPRVKKHEHRKVLFDTSLCTKVNEHKFMNQVCEAKKYFCPPIKVNRDSNSR